LLLQHENAFCEPLNGPLWYLPAVLIMHCIIDVCKKTHHFHPLMLTLCVISFFLYAANKYWAFLPNLTPMGLFRNLPYYYIGYVMGQRHLFRHCNSSSDLLGMVFCMTASLLLFAWHLHEDIFLLHIALFYPVNICFFFGVLYGCKLLNNHSTGVVVNLSAGTLVIIGLHFPLISLANFLLEHTLGLSATISYHWYEALPLTLIITVLLYPLILFARRHFPLLIGKKA
jgi:hypothetical protein